VQMALRLALTDMRPELFLVLPEG